jgi:hypothetical protein
MLRWVICTALGEPVDRIDRRRREQIGDGEDLNALLLEDRDRDRERFGDDDRLRLDHADDRERVLGPHRQVGTRCRLVQHRQAGAAHPQTLCGRGDLHREPGENTDGVAVADACLGQTTGDAAGALVYLTPGVADRFVRFTGDHAPLADAGVPVHLLGESAHDDLLGFRSANVRL